jgi:hypothetical protein
MQLTVDDNYSRSIYWDAPRPLEVRLPGDGSRTICGTDGYATKIRDKLTWINGIVEFWAPKTCKSWTNPAGEPFWWCWANR